MRKLSGADTKAFCPEAAEKYLQGSSFGGGGPPSLGGFALSWAIERRVEFAYAHKAKIISNRPPKGRKGLDHPMRTGTNLQVKARFFTNPLNGTIFLACGYLFEDPRRRAKLFRPLQSRAASLNWNRLRRAVHWPFNRVRRGTGRLELVRPRARPKDRPTVNSKQTRQIRCKNGSTKTTHAAVLAGSPLSRSPSGRFRRSCSSLTSKFRRRSGRGKAAKWAARRRAARRLPRPFRYLAKAVLRFQAFGQCRHERLRGIGQAEPQRRGGDAAQSDGKAVRQSRIGRKFAPPPSSADTRGH